MTRNRSGWHLPSWAQGLIGFAVLAGVLEALPRLHWVSPRYLPPFSELMQALYDEATRSAFWSALGTTAKGWFVGLGIAVALGIVLGVVIGSIPIVRTMTASTIEFLRPIPSVALIPLAVLLFGTEIGSTLLLVVYASFWQVLIQVLYGVQDVDPIVRDTARSFRFRPASMVRHVLWPTALPYIMTGVRLAAAVALILAIIAELVIGGPGLGNQIAVAKASGAYASMYALVIVTGVLGVIVNIGARALERRVLAWHPSVRTEAVS